MCGSPTDGVRVVNEYAFDMLVVEQARTVNEFV